MARPQEAPLKSRINLAVKLFKMNNVFFTFHSLSVSTKKKKKKKITMCIGTLALQYGHVRVTFKI